MPGAHFMRGESNRLPFSFRTSQQKCCSAKRNGPKNHSSWQRRTGCNTWAIRKVKCISTNGRPGYHESGRNQRNMEPSADPEWNGAGIQYPRGILSPGNWWQHNKERGWPDKWHWQISRLINWKTAGNIEAWRWASGLGRRAGRYDCRRIRNYI